MNPIPLQRLATLRNHVRRPCHDDENLQSCPDPGSVDITFGDSTDSTTTITMLGVTDHGSGARVLVKGERVGRTWMIDLLPKAIHYPDGRTGTMTYAPNDTDFDGNIYWNGLR